MLVITKAQCLGEVVQSRPLLLIHNPSYRLVARISWQQRLLGRAFHIRLMADVSLMIYVSEFWAGQSRGSNPRSPTAPHLYLMFVRTLATAYPLSNVFDGVVHRIPRLLLMGSRAKLISI